ncbi:MAG: prolyl oligopeptidase family serine peptidase [Clostridiales bacterium]|nr:prolyl oligopeptidase family serine peptidase [Clostridiales bacterium]
MEKWRDRYRMERFLFEDREALIVFPEKRDKKGRWALKTEYFSAFQDLEEKLVEQGFHLLYLKNRNRWGTDDDLDAKKRFSEAMAGKYGLNARGVLIGMSCGGLHAIKQAARWPEMAALIYLDAPVVNLLSCPFGLGACGTQIDPGARQEALDALGLDMSGMIAYRDHPLDRLPELIRHRVPALLVWGEEDTIVPFEENGKYVLQAYRDTGIPFLAQSKPETNHHPHGPADMESALKFILENS